MRRDPHKSPATSGPRIWYWPSFSLTHSGIQVSQRSLPDEELFAPESRRIRKLSYQGGDCPLPAKEITLRSASEANRATAGDLPQPQAHFRPQSKNFFGLAHGQSPGWQAILPFLGRLPAIVLSSAVGPWKLIRRSRTRFRDRPKTVRLHPGIGVHLHPGSLFGIIPESRSLSSGIPIRARPSFTTENIRRPEAHQEHGSGNGIGSADQPG